MDRKIQNTNKINRYNNNNNNNQRLWTLASPNLWIIALLFNKMKMIKMRYRQNSKSNNNKLKMYE